MLQTAKIVHIQLDCHPPVHLPSPVSNAALKQVKVRHINKNNIIVIEISDSLEVFKLMNVISKSG